MDLTLNDLMALKGMGNENALTPYEQVKLDYMSRKSNTSGLGIAGLTVGVGAGIAAVAGTLIACSAAKNAKDVAIAKNDGLRDLVQTLAGTLVAERTERIEGDRTLSISINDTLSGQQSGQLTASQIAQQEQAQQLQFGLMTGKYSENPQKVMIYSAPQPCGCPGCGN
jgi:hypothetical protein